MRRMAYKHEQASNEEKIQLQHETNRARYEEELLCFCFAAAALLVTAS